MPNHGDTPTRAKNTHTADYQSAHVADARATLISDVPKVPEVTQKSLIEAVLAIISLTVLKKNSQEPTIQWLNRKSGQEPKVEFLEKVWEEIQAAASPWLGESGVNCMIDGNGAPFGSRNDQSRPDGFLYRGEQKNKPKPVGWVDIVQSMEFKRKYDQSGTTDDYTKIMWSMHHIMRNDACRRFALGLTCENTTARLWYNDRCDIVASEEFDINKDWKTLVHIMLSMSQATPVGLGYDPDMKPLPSPLLGIDPKYDITIHNSDTYERTVYRTCGLISNFRADSPIGSGTRVWYVDELKKGAPSWHTYVLKDTWIREDCTPEHATLKYIRDTREELSQYFLTVLNHGFGSFDVDVDDNTHNTLRRKELKPTNNVIIIRSTNTNRRGQEGRSMPTHSVGYPEHPPSPSPEAYRDFGNLSEHPLDHYRIVFKEIGIPVHKLRNSFDIFIAIQGGLKGAHAMHCCGLVHRDISSGNILLVGASRQFKRRGVLADLEYAKKIDDTSAPHGMKTGTALFMATEVAFMEHFRLKELRDLPVSFPRLPGNAESSPDCNDKPLPPFRHNPLHDMESIWWVCIWTMLYLVPAGRNSAVQLESYHRVFHNKDSRHDFICHRAHFRRSTTHLEETPSVVKLMKTWAQSLNKFYKISYMQQDASEAHLTGIRIDDKTIKAAYDRGDEILEELKQTCEWPPTKLVSLAECGHETG